MHQTLTDIGTGIIALLVFIAFALVFTSCSTPHGSAQPGYWKQAQPGDPQAKFGILIEPTIGQRPVDSQK